MGAIPPGADTVVIEQEIASVLSQVRMMLNKSQQFGKISFGKILERLFDIVQKYGISIPPDIFLVAKALLSFETTLYTLCPTIDLIETMQTRINSMFIDKVKNPFTGQIRNRVSDYLSMAIMDFAATYRQLGENGIVASNLGIRDTSAKDMKPLASLLSGGMLILAGGAIAILVPNLSSGVASIASFGALILVGLGLIPSLRRLFH